MLFMAMMSLGGEKPSPDKAGGRQDTDEALLERVGKGDEDAFRQLYQNTDRTIYSYILSFVKNVQDAEEIMQETYLKVWTSAAAYRPQGKPLAWMFTIAKNICYMKFREKKHEADVGLDDLTGEETGEFCPQLENAADKLALQAALEILKEDERQIVLLHASAGMKHREIAANLKMPLATVLSKYNRAMKKMEKFLGKEE